MSVDQSVTRLEIAEAVGGVFEFGGASRREVLAAAETGESRPEVIAVLNQLPERRYRRLNELWEELHGVPVGV